MMNANRLILFLCFYHYQAVQCTDLAKDNGNDGKAASERDGKVGNVSFHLLEICGSSTSWYKQRRKRRISRVIGAVKSKTVNI